MNTAVVDKNSRFILDREGGFSYDNLRVKKFDFQIKINLCMETGV